MSKKKISSQEVKERQEFLKNESITDRTKRVLNPRINRLRKNIKDLTKAINSPRYHFNQEQKDGLTEALESDVDEFLNAIRGSTDEEIKDIL